MSSITKRVLITGGAGFLGSHLCDHYLNSNWQVICVDNLYTGRMENIKHLDENQGFSFLKHDIINPLNIDDDLDLILNFACPASPVHYQSDPIATFKTSVLGMLNLLELAKKKNARILQASTSEVYGDPLMHPQKETYWGNVNCTGIRSCYDEGKRAAETLCFDYQREHKVDIKIVRIFNTYGPRMCVDDGRVVSNFICQALKSEDLTIFGDGQQTRSFCYVDNLIDGITKMAASENFVGPVNLGNSNEFTVKELADRVLNMVETDSKLSTLPLPADDPKVRKPDCTLAHEKLGWTADIQLEDGLKKTIDYFKATLNA